MLGLHLITVDRAYEVVSRGICQPFDTLIAGWVYDLVDACHRYDIFGVLKQNYLHYIKLFNCRKNVMKTNF